jgi:prepilin-type N-terminal cleavage/methylation domain
MAPRKFRKSGSLAFGFSMMELLMVIAVIAILALMATPAIISNASLQRTRGQAMDMATVMRQARLKASVTQKPVRVVVDCSGADCIMRSQLAHYDQGEVAGWVDIAGTRRVFETNVKVVRATPVGSTPDGEVIGDDFVWIIFTPGGKALSNPRPFKLYFYNTRQNFNIPGWRLSVNNNSGRAALDRHKQDIN